MDQTSPQEPATTSSPNKDEPFFEDIGVLQLTPVLDPDTEKLKQDTLKKLERQTIEKDLMKGADEVRPIPVELPMLVFRYGAKIIGCERFNTDTDENRMIAKHLTVIFGKTDSKIFSALIIIVIVLGKIVTCKELIMSKLGIKPEPEKYRPFTPAPIPEKAYRPEMDNFTDSVKKRKGENKVQATVRKLTPKKDPAEAKK